MTLRPNDTRGHAGPSAKEKDLDAQPALALATGWVRLLSSLL
jgi:hypothetical protein